MKSEKVTSGVPGFDNLIDGGFPKSSTILLSGEPGTGKTIFGMQFLIEGAKKNQKGIYVSFEQKMDDLTVQGDKFGWDLKKFIDDGVLEMHTINVREFKMNDLISEIKRQNVDRVVIDSLSSIASHPIAWEDIDPYYMLTDKLDRLVPSPKNNATIAARILIHKLVDELNELPCTSILTSELIGGSAGFSRDTISEFLADGLVILRYMVLGGEYSRNIRIQKMRYSKHSENIHPIEISDEHGFRVIED